jgi:hypothetical protein
LKLLGGLTGSGRPLPRWLSRPLLRLPQHHHEARQCRARKALMKQDKRQRRTLAFSGRFE